MDNRQLIGLEVAKAKQLLLDNGISNYQFVLFTDRKQCHFDKEIVVRATVEEGIYRCIVCPIQVAVLDEHV